MRKVLRFTPKGGRGTLENTSKTRVLRENNVKTRGKCSGSPQRGGGAPLKHEQNMRFCNSYVFLRFWSSGWRGVQRERGVGGIG